MSAAAQLLTTSAGSARGAGLATSGSDPDAPRSQVVDLTTRGQAFVNQAAAILCDLEVDLAQRLGRDAVTSLRRALVTDPGPLPTTAPTD